MKVLVKNIIQETEDAITICLKNGNLFKKFTYKPGQFLTIQTFIEGMAQKRAYSFSSNPYSDKDLKITVKRVANGSVSNYLHNTLKEGDKIKIENPAGSFYIEPKNSNKEQYVLFAGGSGITPIFSIIKSVLTQEPNSKVLLIYANQKKDSIIFHNQIKELEVNYPNTFKVEHIVSQTNVLTKNYHPGLATKILIDAIMLKHNIQYSNHVYMICGPFGYMEKIKEILADNGITRDKIKIEVFKSPVVKVTGKNLISNVTLKHNGKEYCFKVRGDKSILNQAMSENIVLPYSCRSGMCSTCKGKCIEGEVQMTEGHILPDKEVAHGGILTCVSYPLSKNVVIEI